MKPILKDERGVAMVLELVLIVFVVGLAALAVYQSSHHTQAPGPVAARTQAPPPNSTAGVAAQVAAQAQADAASQAATAADTQSAAAQVSQSDSDVNNLGGTSNVSF